MTDPQLLDRFAAGDEEAFAELARRHAGWIYRLAVRRLGNAALAEDATQAVFLVFLRKAASLSKSTPLAAWLHRTAVLVTKEITRGENRRTKREEAFALMRKEQTMEAENLWNEISPRLETTLGRLGKSDRHAILLRYYAQRDFVDIAAEMGVTEIAARKRVERALHKLRRLFAAGNIHTTADLCGSALMLHAGGAASGQVLSRITAGAATSDIAAISNAVLRKIRWMKAGLIGGLAGIASLAVVVTAAVRSSALPNPSPARPVGLVTTLPNPSAVIAVDPELNRLIAQLQTSETKIHNLHIIHFNVIQQRRVSTSSQWAPTPGRFEGSAWFDDVGGGRSRYQFTKSVQEMTDQKSGKKEWWSTSSDCGTDGKQTRFTASSDDVVVQPPPGVHISIDPSMQIYPGVDFMLTAIELPHQPWSIASAEVAVMFDKTPKYPRYHARISEEILEQIAKGAKFQVQHKKINGVQAVGIVAEKLMPGDFSEEWWFDPQRNYTVVENRAFYAGAGHPKTSSSVEINKWKLVGPGIWFPTGATCEEDQQAYSDRFIYSVEDVIANDPKFDQADFLPPIKVGERVLDYHSNPPKEYHFSEDSGIP